MNEATDKNELFVAACTVLSGIEKVEDLQTMNKLLGDVSSSRNGHIHANFRKLQRQIISCIHKNFTTELAHTLGMKEEECGADVFEMRTMTAADWEKLLDSPPEDTVQALIYIRDELKIVMKATHEDSTAARGIQKMMTEFLKKVAEKIEGIEREEKAEAPVHVPTPREKFLTRLDSWREAEALENFIKVQKKMLKRIHSDMKGRLGPTVLLSLLDVLRKHRDGVSQPLLPEMQEFIQNWFTGRKVMNEADSVEIINQIARLHIAPTNNISDFICSISKELIAKGVVRNSHRIAFASSIAKLGIVTDDTGNFIHDICKRVSAHPKVNPEGMVHLGWSAALYALLSDNREDAATHKLMDMMENIDIPKEHCVRQQSHALMLMKRDIPEALGKKLHQLDMDTSNESFSQGMLEKDVLKILEKRAIPEFQGPQKRYGFQLDTLFGNCLNVELDGPQHSTTVHRNMDYMRDTILHEKGIEVLRLSGKNTARKIVDTIEEYVERFFSGNTSAQNYPA